jgi:hypothetical protein
MKKYAFYIVIIAILVTIALVLVFNDKPGTITGSEKNFAISDTAQVTKIRYVYKGEVLELTRNKSQWVVNNKYPAKIQLVNVTLKFLQQFNIISAVPKESIPLAIEALNERSLQVTVEDSGKPMVQYRFCEIDTAPSKAYIIMEGSSRPYIANITGFDLPLLTLFSTSERMWRDRKIFITPVSEMMMVGLAYPKQPDNSFAILRMNDSLQIKSGEEIIKNVSSEAAQNLFTGVSDLKADHIGTERLSVVYNKVRNELPFVELIIKNRDNRLETLKIYQIPDGNNPSKNDPDALLGIIGKDTIPVLINYIDFDPLLKLKGDFVEK